MKDLIAKLQLDANCALGAIWMHIDTQEKRIAELEAQQAFSIGETYASALSRIAYLEKRIEFNGDHSQDGIAKRDERIAELEAQIAAASAPVVEQQPVLWYDATAEPHEDHGQLDESTRQVAILGTTRGPWGAYTTPLYAAHQAADTDKLREALESLYYSLPDILPESAHLRLKVDGRWAHRTGPMTGFISKLEYRADDMASVYEAMDLARAVLGSSTALQAPVREVPGWQPIETAPKDGTCILVCRAWDADGKPMGNSHRLFTHRAAWWADENGGNGEWIVYNSMVKDPECFFTPTHWMPVPDIEVSPLPAAPVQHEGE